MKCGIELRTPRAATVNVPLIVELIGTGLPPTAGG